MRLAVKRRLLTLAAAALLVLCAATLALWVRSYWRYDTLSYTRPPRHVLTGAADHVSRSRTVGCRASSGRGLITIGRFDVFPRTPGYVGRGLMWQTSPWDKAAWAEPAPKWHHLGVRYWHEAFSSGEFAYLRLSHWHVIAPSAIVLCLCVIARGRTWHCGHCHTCGYDLRATPARCPECGGVPAAR
jgi:hypothetical protein